MLKNIISWFGYIFIFFGYLRKYVAAFLSSKGIFPFYTQTSIKHTYNKIPKGLCTFWHWKHFLSTATSLKHRLQNCWPFSALNIFYQICNFGRKSKNNYWQIKINESAILNFIFSFFIILSRKCCWTVCYSLFCIALGKLSSVKKNLLPNYSYYSPNI